MNGLKHAIMGDSNGVGVMKVVGKLPIRIGNIFKNGIT